jgi:hypothetical protein
MKRGAGAAWAAQSTGVLLARASASADQRRGLAAGVQLAHALVVGLHFGDVGAARSSLSSSLHTPTLREASGT